MVQDVGSTNARPFSGPVFILGMPRSGTKLLREIFNRHGDVYIPDVETEFLPFLAARWSDPGALADRGRFSAFYKQMLGLPYFRYRIDQGKLIGEQQWYSACRTFDPGGVFEALIRSEAGLGWDKAGIWGDKSPSYITHVPLLHGLFPQAKFLHIVRDVRDHCRSVLKAWGKNPIRAAFRWNDALLKLRADVEALRPDYAEVRYEQLITHPESEVTRLCAFIGIEFRKKMLDIAPTTENIGDAAGKSTIVSGNMGKYLTAFDGKTVRRIEEAALPAMQHYNYQPVFANRYRPPAAMRLRLYQLLDGYHLLNADHAGSGRLAGALFHIAYKRLTRTRS